MSLFVTLLVLGFFVSVQTAVIVVLIKMVSDQKDVNKKLKERANKVKNSLKRRISSLEEDVESLEKRIEKLEKEMKDVKKDNKELKRRYGQTRDVISGLLDMGMLIKDIKYPLSFEEVHKDMKEVAEFYSLENMTPGDVEILFGTLNPYEELDLEK